MTPGDADFVLDIVLPTGAMGNVAGGYMAKKMGLPLGKLCCGVNINDITHRAIQTGKFHRSDSMEKTLSDAINIQVVSLEIQDMGPFGDFVLPIFSHQLLLARFCGTLITFSV